MSRRELAPVLSSNTHAVCAVAPDVIRLDVDTEDGAVVAALLDIDAAKQLCRDLSRAIHTAMRME